MKRMIITTLALFLFLTLLIGCTDKPVEQETEVSLPTAIVPGKAENDTVEAVGTEPVPSAVQTETKPEPAATAAAEPETKPEADTKAVTEPEPNTIPVQTEPEEEIEDSVVVEITGDVGIGGN